MEITKISNNSVLIGGTKFIAGITYTFPANLVMPAGARYLIVLDPVVFAAQYPGVPQAQVIGQYSGALSNGGEQITFTDSANVIIKDFIYDDITPWPLPPDGTGPSLVLIKPETNPAHATAANWRSSTSAGGNPGTTDATTLSDWFVTHNVTDTTGLGDKDSDGLQDLIEYALRLNPSTSNISNLAHGSTAISGQDYLTLTMTKPISRDSVSSKAEGSQNLASWSDLVLMSATPNFITGLETQIWRNSTPTITGDKQFLRLKISR